MTTEEMCLRCGTIPNAGEKMCVTDEEALKCRWMVGVHREPATQPPDGYSYEVHSKCQTKEDVDDIVKRWPEAQQVRITRGRFGIYIEIWKEVPTNPAPFSVLTLDPLEKR